VLLRPEGSSTCSSPTAMTATRCTTSTRGPCSRRARAPTPTCRRQWRCGPIPCRPPQRASTARSVTCSCPSAAASRRSSPSTGTAAPSSSRRARGPCEQGARARALPESGPLPRAGPTRHRAVCSRHSLCREGALGRALPAPLGRHRALCREPSGSPSAHVYREQYSSRHRLLKTTKKRVKSHDADLKGS
jgi:hypothetical protein